MIWQDLVISIGEWIFIVSLMFSIFSKNKPSIYTSLTTGIVLTFFGISFFTLNLYMAGVSSLGCAICWYILFVQKLKC
ncbi:MAG: hypothetical protein ACOC1P_04125 [Minisyncoccales bacterium]